VYWPILDITLWGLASKWILTQQEGKVPHLALILLTGVVFWQVVWRGSYEISVNLLEEFWNDNLVNLFATSLTKYEWMAGVMLVGLVKLFLTLVVGIATVWLFYSLNIFVLGWSMLPFVASLLMSGWFVGFFSSGLIIRYGEKIQTLAWVMGWMLAPFSAVFYPLNVLPEWAQVIARCLPTTYVFEGMRQIIANGSPPWDYVLISLGLNVLYLGASVAFFSYMFEQRRWRGLAK